MMSYPIRCTLIKIVLINRMELFGSEKSCIIIINLVSPINFDSDESNCVQYDISYIDL